MKFFLVACALIAAVAADVSHLPSNEYLPPHSGAASAPQVSFAPAPAPAPAPVVSYAPAPAASYQSVSYAAPAPAPAPVYHAAASAPVASYSAGGVGGGSFGGGSFGGGAGGASYQVAASAPAPSYQATSYEGGAGGASYETAASEPAPAHTYSSDSGYRYKTQRRVVYRHRHRRGVSNEYLPPFQGSASVSVPSQDYLPPQSTNVVQQYAPAPQYAAPSEPAVEYETAPSEPAPAHSYTADSGYRYRTNRRRVYRRRRY